MTLEQMRKQKGLSQTKLAKIVGIDNTTISKIENKRITPSLKVAMKIAKTLGVSVEELFPDFDGTPNPSLENKKEVKV